MPSSSALSYREQVLTSERAEALDELWNRCQDRKLIWMILNLYPGKKFPFSYLYALANSRGLQTRPPEIYRMGMTGEQKALLTALWKTEMSVYSIQDHLARLGPYRPDIKAIQNFTHRNQINRPKGYSGKKAARKYFIRKKIDYSGLLNHTTNRGTEPQEKGNTND